MKKLYILSLIAYALFALHIIEELLRFHEGEFDPSVFIALVLYPVALAGLYINKKWGIWLAAVLNAITFIIIGFSHFNPGSHDSAIAIYNHWTGITGIIAAFIGTTLPFSGLAGLVVGINIIRSKV